MAKNYAALARSVIAALGGVDNISAVTLYDAVALCYQR
ncbi:phosphotransferase system, EIIB family protein [Escherichia coli 1-392-07_S3_C1]|nr:phosphotransferase system, EIIB family protein [Escherichia coli 1-392-07_S3_C3]KDW57473.1 phosphotransferase system, EIIB family protein [Escherichia coli 1-392-07_S3_C2]KDX03412.1 phosphotransferase system, EIIB family protein [Escherichia coli 1-392-07_S3_C1]